MSRRLMESAENSRHHQHRGGETICYADCRLHQFYFGLSLPNQLHRRILQRVFEVDSGLPQRNEACGLRIFGQGATPGLTSTFTGMKKSLSVQEPPVLGLSGVSHCYLGGFYSVAPWPLQDRKKALEQMVSAAHDRFHPSPGALRHQMVAKPVA